MKIVFDNDVLLKGACYGLLDQFISAECEPNEVIGILGAARFVVASKIRGRSNRSAWALQNLAAFLPKTEILEPSEREQSMAADLELAGQKAGLNLNSGESLLCSIVVYRALALLLTGDKRAIEAIDRLLDCDSRLDKMKARVECIEQLIAKLLCSLDASELQRAICSEPDIDKALANCFSCRSPDVRITSFAEGLYSYIEDLRAVARRVLIS
jgi:hypothetical protein